MGMTRAEGEPAVDVRAVDDGVQIEVQGDVDIAAEPKLRAALDQAERRSPRRIILDFCSARFAGVPAVRLALAAVGTASRRGGTVVVRGQRNVQRLFHITGTQDVVELEDCPDP